MVTYQVQIPESNQAAFMDIIKSLQSLGVISSFSISESLAHPGDPVAIDNLLEMLQSAEKQAEDGTVVPANQVIEFMKSWRERK